jgi:pimeloyl-ACP methyl ester carboxylesterase
LGRVVSAVSAILKMPIDTKLVDQPPGASPDTLTDDATAITTADGCPAPLSWAQVLEAFHHQSTAWTVEADGRPFSGRTIGAGRPLYFLNGLAGTSDLFCLIVWLLRDEFRCVVLDYPTQADRRRAALTKETLASGLFAAADRQGDRTFSIFATGFGSVVGLTALGVQPDRIDRAIFQAGFAHRKLSATERLLARIGRHAHGSLASVPLLSTFHQANHQRYFPPFDASRWGFFIDNTGRTAIRDASERAMILASFDDRDRLPDIRQPILLIRSEHEGRVAADCNETLQGGLPNSTTEILHSTGPLAHLTHPHRVVKLVKTLLGDVAGRPDADSVCLNEAH